MSLTGQHWPRRQGRGHPGDPAMSTPRVMLAPVWAREASEVGYGRSCRRVACMSSRACVGQQVMQDPGLAVREYPEVARIGAAVPRDAPGGVRVRERAAHDRPQRVRRRHPDLAGPRDVGAGREGGRRRCSRGGTTDRRGHVAASRLAGACAAARRAAIGQARNVASARIDSVTRALGAGHRAAAEQAFSHGYQVAVLIAGLGLIAAAIIAAFGLRDNRRRELDAGAGKPAPPGDPDNPTIVAQPHHTFVTRPDGGHSHVNH